MSQKSIFKEYCKTNKPHIRFMHENNIVTKDDLDNFDKDIQKEKDNSRY